MYLRTTTRRASDGSVVRYVQLAHNRRVNGVTQAHVLVNLGREEHLDVEGLRRLVGSIRRRLGDAPDGAASGAAGAPDGRGAVQQVPGNGDGPGGGFGQVEALRVVDVRPMGTLWLLDGLWTALGVDVALRAGVGARRWTADVDRVAFAGVAVRAVEPGHPLEPARRVEEWVTRDVAVPGLEAMTPGEVGPVLELVGFADVEWRLDADPGVRTAPPGRDVALGSRADRRRHGQAVLAWLAAVLVEVVEVRTGLAWPLVRAEADRLAAVTVAGPHGTLVATSEPTQAQLDLFAACGVRPPPRTLALTLL